MNNKIPRGIRTFFCIAGLIGCVLTIVVGFLPPSNTHIESQFHYALWIGAGLLLMTAPVFLLWGYQNRQKYRLPEPIRK
jgi:multidrug transporter EmrE-like cation transporter